MVEGIVLFVIILVVLTLVSFFTGEKEYLYKPKDDERQKAVVQSWVLLMLLWISNIVMVSIFQRNTSYPLNDPEVFYILVAIVSYFIFYFINSRKMSA